MIDAEGQEELLSKISNLLKENITAYAIGGTAMIFLGLKDQTLDLDLVFLNEKERDLFVIAVKSLGFEEVDARIVYRKKKNAPLMIKLEEARFDLFLKEVISTKFSNEMISRVQQTHEFNKYLIIKVADVHDILIMKCVTLREKDVPDILEIIKTKKINWDLIIQEAENQIDLGNERAVLDIGTTLEKIKNKHKGDIPDFVLNKLWGMLEEQIKKKKIKK